MKKFIAENILNLQAALAILVAVNAAFRWSTMPVLSRMVCLFFIALVLHIWEESRFPGGFTDLITDKLHFTASDPHFGELVTAAYALIIGFVPLFFPQTSWLAMTVMILGVLEFVVHTAAIKLFRLKHFYSPGLVTATVLMLPISLYTIGYVVRHDLMHPAYWLLSFAYLAAGLMVAQRIVVRASGMKYSAFLKNVRAAVFNKTVE